MINSFFNYFYCSEGRFTLSRFLEQSNSLLSEFPLGLDRGRGLDLDGVVQREKGLMSMLGAECVGSSFARQIESSFI